MVEKLIELVGLMLAMLSILVWGVIATLCMALIMMASQKLGWSRMNWSLLVGSLFTGDRQVAAILGSTLNFFGGCFLAYFYFLLFGVLGKASWWLGGIAGMAHGALVLAVFLPLLIYGHPRVASSHDGVGVHRRLEPPGFLALNYGPWTPAVTLLAFGVYGMVLGSAFHHIR